MRTFIAVEPPGSLREEIGRLTARHFESRLPGFRWVKPENIHLTLRFLGEIDPAGLDSLTQAVCSAAAKSTPFELTVDSLGFFGSNQKPRVVWLSLGVSPQLSALAAEVEGAVVKSGFGRADKPFRAHLTLARMKRPPASPPDWEGVRSILPSSWPGWNVSHVEIIKSTLTPSGPVYQTLARCPLVGEAGEITDKGGQ